VRELIGLSEVKLYTYGDILVELSANVDDLPILGSDQTIKSFRILPGGSSPNSAVSASILRVQVHQIGVVGNDVFSTILLDDLKSCGVCVDSVVSVSGSSAFAVILVDKNGERTMLSYRDISISAVMRELYNVKFSLGDFLHISGYVYQSLDTSEVANNLLRNAKNSGVYVSLDPSYQFATNQPLLSPNLMEDLDYIFPNNNEAYHLTGQESPDEAVKALLDMGVGCAVITCGNGGCVIGDSSARETIQIPSYEVSTPLDTTGAGDSFIGGFLAARIKGYNLEQSAKVGHAIAANVIMTYGGHAGAPSLERLRSFVIDNQDDDLLKDIIDRLC